jgi:hypothetical protein
MRKFWLPLLLALSLNQAYADDPYINRIKSEQDIRRFLEAQSLSISSFESGEIEHYCIDIFGFGDRRTFYRCKYIQAKNIAYYKKIIDYINLGELEYSINNIIDRSYIALVVRDAVKKRIDVPFSINNNDQYISKVKSDKDIEKYLHMQHLNVTSDEIKIAENNCQNSEGFSNKKKYIRCKYIHARNAGVFKIEKEICRQIAESKEQKNITLSHESKTIAVESKATTAGSSKGKITGDLTRAANQCMVDYGWNDPDDWKAGGY